MKQKIFWFFWIIIVGIFALFVPPFQKPDEPEHFYRAMALSSGQFFCSAASFGFPAFQLSKSVYEFPKQMQTDAIVMRYEAKFPIGFFKHSYPYKDDHTVVYASQSCTLPFPAYIFFAGAVSAVAPFDNLLFSFYAMRISAALVAILFAIVGFRIIPNRYKLIYLFLISNPMYIHQVTSVSYDAMQNILGMSVFALWLFCLEKKKNSRKNIAILSFFIICFCIVKQGYYLAIGMLLPIFLNSSLSKRHRVSLFISLIILFGCVLCISPVRNIFFDTFLTHNAPQIYVVFHDPINFFTVIVRTCIESHEQMMQGLVGLFGWVDYRLPLYMVCIYAGVCGIVSYEYVKNKTKPFPVWIIGLLGIISIGTVLFIFYLFYRNATPIAYKTVVGIQGRYFLPLLPFIMLVLLESAVVIKIKRVAWIAAGILGLAATSACVYIIFFRYYDYSGNFSNPNALVKEIENQTVDVQRLVPLEINKKELFFYDVSYPDYKIGGIQMIAQNEFEVNIPYKIIIKDSSCSRVLYQGYLNEFRDDRLAHLKGEHDLVMTQYFSIIPLYESKICLVLEPFADSFANPVYLRLLSQDDKPLIRFLYIAH